MALSEQILIVDQKDKCIVRVPHTHTHTRTPYQTLVLFSDHRCWFLSFMTQSDLTSPALPFSCISSCLLAACSVYFVVVTWSNFRRSLSEQGLFACISMSKPSGLHWVSSIRMGLKSFLQVYNFLSAALTLYAHLFAQDQSTKVWPRGHNVVSGTEDKEHTRVKVENFKTAAGAKRKTLGAMPGERGTLTENLPTVPAHHLLTHKLIRAPGISAKCRIIHVVASCGGALFTDGR